MNNTHLTVDSLPSALLHSGALLKEKRDYEVLPDIELIAGKSVVLNGSGKMYLYMGDDPRNTDKYKQIMVHNFGGEVVFLPMESKQAIQLKMYK